MSSDCPFCMSEYEDSEGNGIIFVDAHGHDGSVAQLEVPCPVCNEVVA
mgnify:CR=1 FL=1